MKVEHTECSETSAYKIQTPGNYTEEYTENSEKPKVWNEEELYLYSPSGPSWPVIGWPLPLPLSCESKNVLLGVQERKKNFYNRNLYQRTYYSQHICEEQNFTIRKLHWIKQHRLCTEMGSKMENRKTKCRAYENVLLQLNCKGNIPKVPCGNPL